MPGADDLQVEIHSKRFGDRLVLKDLAFSARGGDVLALLAPSGTGKTTCLRIVLGLDQNFSGRVQRPPGRTGVVFQEPRLLPWMDVAANLRLVAPALDDGQIEHALAKVGLPGSAAQFPNKLSLGMARRVALARALVVRPSLLVMDEPFASLDPQRAAALSRQVAVFARDLGCIVLVATHDLDQALAMADRLLILGGPAPVSLAAGEHSGAEVRERFPFLREG
jgi:NitT/TauT family transport system ATP-binding protein